MGRVTVWKGLPAAQKIKCEISQMPAVKRKRAKAKDSAVAKYVKDLGSNDRNTRLEAVDSVKKFLQTKRDIDELELHKICLGLFYAMWSCDRPRTQQALATDLADMFLVVHESYYYEFVQAFWAILAKEYEKIDRFRIDKFYMLMRRVVHASLTRLKNSDWDEEEVHKFNKAMAKTAMNADDARVPNGLRFHVQDVYADEVERVLRAGLKEGEEPDVESVPMQLLFTDIYSMAQNGYAKFFCQRVERDILSDGRLAEWGLVAPERK